MLFLHYALIIIKITHSSSATRCVKILKVNRKRDENILSWVGQKPGGNKVNTVMASKQAQINMVSWIQYRWMSISKRPYMVNRDQTSRTVQNLEVRCKQQVQDKRHQSIAENPETKTVRKRLLGPHSNRIQVLAQLYSVDIARSFENIGVLRL